MNRGEEGWLNRGEGGALRACGKDLVRRNSKTVRRNSQTKERFFPFFETANLGHESKKPEAWGLGGSLFVVGGA